MTLAGNPPPVENMPFLARAGIDLTYGLEAYWGVDDAGESARDSQVDRPLHN